MKNLSKNQIIGTVIGIAVVGFFFIFGNTLITLFETGTLASASDQTNTTTMADTLATSTEATSTELAGINPATPGQLGIQDVTVGNGAVAEPGDTVTVNYVGTLTDGTVFDSSIARNQPFSFQLGAGQVIAGWDQGVAGMRVGGERVLTIPPSLGYGVNAVGPIPANSTLIFKVDLLNVQSASASATN